MFVLIRSQQFSITKTGWLVLFREIISACSENRKNVTGGHTVGKMQFLKGRPSDLYCYNTALKG